MIAYSVPSWIRRQSVRYNSFDDTKRSIRIFEGRKNWRFFSRPNDTKQTFWYAIKLKWPTGCNFHRTRTVSSVSKRANISRRTANNIAQSYKELEQEPTASFNPSGYWCSSLLFLAIRQSVGRSVGQWVDRSVRRSFDRSVRRPVSRYVDRNVRRSVGQSDGWSGRSIWGSVGQAGKAMPFNKFNGQRLAIRYGDAISSNRLCTFLGKSAW